MPRQGLSIIGRPEPRYDPAKAINRDGTRDFRSKSACRGEDTIRSKLMDSARERYPEQFAGLDAKKLVKALMRSGDSGVFQDTLGSSLNWHRSARPVVGALWKLYDECPAGQKPTTFTIIPRNWEVSPAELQSTNPVALLNGLKTALYSCGAAAAGGWLFASLHSEYDPEADIFRFHVHGLMSREMIPVVDEMRKIPRYKFARTLPDGSWSPVCRRTWIRRLPLVNLPSPLTYLLQAFWPARPILITPEGKRRRVRDKHRMPEPYHSLSLLWLDRWRLDDLTLRIHLTTSPTGFVPTQPKVTRIGGSK